ncbi:MAG: hypothetical protein EXQ86_07195 [Rhodospirillales bacterium]|nr:hypothetical protein [Rhodospirillales bacterium]
MTAVVPPPPPTPPPLGGAVLPTLVLAVAPEALQGLPPNARLEGVILGSTPQGKVKVETPVGTVTLDTNLPLPKGAKLILQIVASGPPVKVHLLAIDGKPLQAALRLLAPAGFIPGSAAGVTGATGGTPHAQANPLAPGALTTATLVRPLAGLVPGAPGFPAPALGAAGGSAGGIASATPGTVPGGLPGAPATTAGPATAAATPAGPHAPGSHASAPAASPGAPGTQGSPGAVPDLAVGTRFPLRIVEIKPPTAGAGLAGTAAPNPLATVAPGQVLTATVTGTTSAGAIMVRSPLGHLLLPSETPLAPGTTLTLEATGKPIPPAPEPTLHAPGSREKLLAGRTWPSMDEAVRALAEANPQIAQQVIDTILPQANNRLAANVLFFLAALRGGELRNWLGEAPARTLQRTRADLMAKLGDDFSAAAKLANEPVSGDWRVAVVPFYTESEIQQVRLFLRARKDDGKEGDESAPKETRFVVDLGLSNIGRLQLDGFVRDKNKRLDLIVRTASPLPPRMRDDIRRLFDESNQLTGMKGGLSFQAAPANFIDVMPAADTRPGLVV